ncbi:hypothetical protein [Methylobacterium sp. AMS5]|uniref:hypothetical protein n=1 Tax=Methylobacterium sp. AMS5 TaxID=925818 RepID=UPI00074F8ABE|nr:hypothetical protein [Methylobacterium sp. AMS5]AMB47843.1 hypothetical protein Y590_23060 [Methylobacterium sp. AMS5]
MASIFSGKAGRQAAIWGAQQLQQGETEAKDALDQGLGFAKDQYGKAAGLFENLAGDYAGGSKLYQDATGANGTDAATAARSAFTASPGYTFNMDQGMQALSRARAVNGTVASGNMDTDAMKFASGLAAQDWNNWLANLANLDTKRYGAVSGQAGAETGLGNVGFQTDTAKGLSTVGQQVLMAGQQAAENRFGALMGGANLPAKGGGALSGNPAALSNVGKNLSSAFSTFG